MKTKELLAEIGDLPVEERVRIADGILKTLHNPNPEMDALWMEEAERRAKEVESGEVTMMPGEEFEKRRKAKKNSE